MENQAKTGFSVDTEKRALVMTRVFDAPRELVYRTYVDPRLIPEWWGPSRLTTTVEKMDVRPGGVWRFIQRDAEGNEYAFNGVFREVAPPERLVYTFEFEGMPGHILVESVKLEEMGDKTRVTTQDTFDTVEDLQGMLQSGMEEGAKESMERFSRLLQNIREKSQRRAV